MRHKKGINHLGRKSAHRNAMLSNLAASLIIHKRISTTLAKAKALRSFVEPLITRSKEDSMHNRRVVFSHLQNKEAVNELFREVADKVADRPGGYTRILKTGVRAGDDAQMCIIELVDYNETLLTAKDKKAGSKRTRRSRTKKTVETPVTELKEEAKVEDVQKKVTEDIGEETIETPTTEEVKDESPVDKMKEEEPKEEKQASEENEEDDNKKDKKET